MQMSTENFRHTLYVLSLLVIIFFPSTVFSSSDYCSKDFSIRLPPAFVRFTEISVLSGEVEKVGQWPKRNFDSIFTTKAEDAKN